MLLIVVGDFAFSEAFLANTEDVWRHKPPASTGNNFKIPIAYHSVFSIPVKEGGALYDQARGQETDLIAFSRGTTLTQQAGEAVVKGRIGLCIFYMCSIGSWEDVTI